MWAAESMKSPSTPPAVMQTGEFTITPHTGTIRSPLWICTVSYTHLDVYKRQHLCTLLDKPERRVKKQVKVDYTCFTIPDEFVVGYGLDYAQKYRNLPYIGVVEVDQ